MTPAAIRIGTRRSRLALWQAEWVAARLREGHPRLRVELVTIRTLGDRDRSAALARLGRPGVFVKEIEDALMDGRCDVAVHSLKDLPTRLSAGLSLGAVLERADARDALVSRSGATLAQLPAGSAVGTSSLRRRFQILHARPDLVVRDLRGNVPTRLRAAGVALEGDDREPAADRDRDARPDRAADPGPERLEAAIVAHAGLLRLGLDGHASEILDFDLILPAPGQGAVAAEIRAEDAATAEFLLALDHGPTRRATAAERAFLEALGGGCGLPAGALALLDATPAGRGSGGEEIRLTGRVGEPDGSRMIEGTAAGVDPVEVGERLAGELLARGAREILARWRAHGDPGTAPPAAAGPRDIGPGPAGGAT